MLCPDTPRTAPCAHACPCVPMRAHACRLRHDMESQAASLRSAVESQEREVAALRGIAAAAEAESAAAKAELAQVGVFMPSCLRVVVVWPDIRRARLPLHGRSMFAHSLLHWRENIPLPLTAAFMPRLTNSPLTPV